MKEDYKTAVNAAVLGILFSILAALTEALILIL